tara:strand:+ start:398 stop:556 length:159 start_codon:yes stop_codon:yes gene_type:complete
MISKDFLLELKKYFLKRKKYWLIPIFGFSLFMGGLIILTEGTALGPIIYTLF